MSPDWKDPRYLQTGNRRQRDALRVLQELGMWEALRGFDPVLAGTVPLAIDTPTSDLDVICEVADADRAQFEQLVRARYGQMTGFRLAQTTVRGLGCVVSNFRHAGFEVELFGQARSTAQQYAFRHLVVEHAVLQAGSEPWRAAVRALKRQGWKTEPAFAHLLGLPGDPYDALLVLETLSPPELAAFLTGLLI